MATVLFMTGESAGDNLGYASRGAGKLLEQMGYDLAYVDLRKPGSTLDIEDILQAKKAAFAVGICGFGFDAFCMNENNEQANIWAHYEVPFLTLHGDSPAYMFDRHVNLTPWHATMYGFADHLDFRMRLPHREGVFGIMVPSIFDDVPKEKIDFKAKREGEIIFPKNAGNPIELSMAWQTHLSKTVAGQLNELSQILIDNIEAEGASDIDALVVDMFNAKGIVIEQATRARLFYVAQLDDFMRRAKCALLFEGLKDLPVKLIGKGWEQYATGNETCTILTECDAIKTREHIKNALAILDFSPNTTRGFHDRFARAVGMKTACLTNSQICVTETFGGDYGLTYDFNLGSITEMVNSFLNNRDEVIEAGIQASERFVQVLTPEAAMASFIDTAEAVRLHAMSSKPAAFDAVQPYLVWPQKI